MEVEARGKRRTVYLTDHLWRLARSWAIANDQTVSEVVERSLFQSLAGLRPEVIMEAQKAGLPLEPADARPVPVLTKHVAGQVAEGVIERLTADATLVKPATKPPTAKAYSEFRPAPKPTSRKKR